MKTSALIGIAVLAIIWLWLACMLLAAGGVTLKNITVLAMSGIIIFVPLARKHSNYKKKD